MATVSLSVPIRGEMADHAGRRKPRGARVASGVQRSERARRVSGRRAEGRGPARGARGRLARRRTPRTRASRASLKTPRHARRAPAGFPVNIFQSEIAAPGDRARGVRDPAIARGGLRGVRTGATALMDIIAAMLNVFVVCFYDELFAAWAD